MDIDLTKTVTLGELQAVIKNLRIGLREDQTRLRQLETAMDETKQSIIARRGTISTLEQIIDLRSTQADLAEEAPADEAAPVEEAPADVPAETTAPPKKPKGKTTNGQPTD